jgi:hypothetical protein
MQTETLTCKNCGSSRIVDGRISEACLAISIPFARRWSLVNDLVTIVATACLECGNVALRVDPERIKSILGEDPK